MLVADPTTPVAQAPRAVSVRTRGRGGQDAAWAFWISSLWDHHPPRDAPAAGSDTQERSWDQRGHRSLCASRTISSSSRQPRPGRRLPLLVATGPLPPSEQP